MLKSSGSFIYLFLRKGYKHQVVFWFCFLHCFVLRLTDNLEICAGYDYEKAVSRHRWGVDK